MVGSQRGNSKLSRLSSNAEVSDTMRIRMPSLCALGALLAVNSFVLADDKTAAPSYPDHSKLLVYRDGENNEHPVRTKDDWLRRRRHILTGMEQAMGPLPDRSKLPPLDVRVGENFDGEGYS